MAMVTGIQLPGAASSDRVTTGFRRRGIRGGFSSSMSRKIGPEEMRNPG